MIGRFSKLGTYKELFDPKEVLRVLLGGLLALIGLSWLRFSESDSLVGNGFVLLSIAINGLPIVWGAISGILKKKINVDELVSIAIMASLFAGEYLSAAMVSFVMMVGALIEEATGESARRAIKALVKITPKIVTVIINGKMQTKEISDINVGDLLLVKPGERIPVDGRITNGITSVDESSITGEPIPVEKSIKDSVYAGTLNENGVIQVTATKVGKDSTLGKVIQLVSEAEAHHPESIALIDRYAKWFTPFILFCAFVTWWWTGEVNRAITVLIVGCPCALILAAPTAIVATISRAAKSGILVKGGRYLEEVATADTVLFDKTGTLTDGNPKVDEIIAAEGYDRQFILTQAACVEQNSTHPLARAVLSAAHYAKVVIQTAEDLVTDIGEGVRGCVSGASIAVGRVGMNGTTMLPQALANNLDAIQARGATPLVVYQDRTPIGMISVSDHVRQIADKTIRNLASLRISKIGILSGDHEISVTRIAKAVGITEQWANLKPQDKLDIIQSLRDSERTRKVIYIGDGINDAPALATADVGVAMGAKGTDVALETADIALMHDDIGRLPFLIHLGRRMVLTMRWNIAFGLLFNLVAVIASGSGFLTPITGAVVHNIGSILVVLSSASISFAAEK